MYTGVLDKNCIRDFFISIGYPMGPSSKIYEENQATIKRVLVDRITPQAIHIGALIPALHELRLRKTFEMVDTRSNMQLVDLNYKPHGGKSLQNLIDHTISVRLYPTQVSLHHQKLCLGQFHEPNHINCKQNKKREIKRQKHPVHKIVLRKPTQIRSKNTAQLFSLYLYGREYSDD